MIDSLRISMKFRSVEFIGLLLRKYPMDAIGTSKKLGTFAVNALPLPGLLIRPNNFTDSSLDQKLSDLGIECIVTPTSQFQLSGGSIHCVTNEL